MGQKLVKTVRPLLISLSVLSVLACGSPSPQSLGSPTPRLTAATIAPDCPNPFGLMLGAPGMTLAQRLQMAKELGALYFRPNAIRVDAWKGTCQECEAAQRAGLKIIITVSNTGGPGQPSRPPTDLTTYSRTMEAILKQLRPEVLVVENEENSELFYLGTPDEYRHELQAACAVAHAHGIPCTNGGLVSKLVALLVYDKYILNGDQNKAQSFAERALTPEESRQVGSPAAQQQIQKGKALLKSYSAAGADYVNFHWYIGNPSALAEAVQFLKEHTGLPAMTNEIGQQDLSPATVTGLMSEVVRLGLPFAVWFSVDAPKAKALMNPDGTPRENGMAFQRFMKSRCQQE